jgi:hypothetical protein
VNHTITEGRGADHATLGFVDDEGVIRAGAVAAVFEFSAEAQQVLFAASLEARHLACAALAAPCRAVGSQQILEAGDLRPQDAEGLRHRNLLTMRPSIAPIRAARGWGLAAPQTPHIVSTLYTSPSTTRPQNTQGPGFRNQNSAFRSLTAAERSTQPPENPCRRTGRTGRPRSARPSQNEWSVNNMRRHAAEHRSHEF